MSGGIVSLANIRAENTSKRLWMSKSGCMLLLGSVLAIPVHGQFFSPESLTGAFLGSLLGGVAGSDCHHGFSGEGAAIGAGIGFVAGAIAGAANRRTETYVCAPPQSVPQPGYGYGYSYTPNTVAVPAPPPRPNYAVGGTLAGAAIGGIVGASQERGWEGAGIGAASGLILGGVAEAATRAKEQKAAAALAKPTPVQTSAPAPAPVSPPARCQTPPARMAPVAPRIPDAPRVPDAPTF